jgi:hypothetical protein
LRQITCTQCGASFPAGQTFQVFGVTMCGPCGDANLRARNLKKVPAGSVVRNIDPTVCAKCGSDWGDRDLRSRGKTPLCERCAEAARNFPFPRWIKISFAALIVVVIADAALNMRYLQAMHEIKQAGRLVKAGNVDGAAAALDDAAKHVPGNGDLELVATTYHAISLLNHDRSTEAEKLLQPLRTRANGNELYEMALLQAHIGAAFDRHDYDSFLEHSLTLLKKSPDEAQAIASVASAYACKFAVTGNDDFKRAALGYLDQARAAKHHENLQEYVDRIMYRLDTRQIITAAEYHRRTGK